MSETTVAVLRRCRSFAKKGGYRCQGVPGHPHYVQDDIAYDHYFISGCGPAITWNDTDASPEPVAPLSINAEAEHLISLSARQGDYRHPLDNFTTIGRLWAADLSAHLGGHVPDLPAEMVAIMLGHVKDSRLLTGGYRWHRDSVVDKAGYAGCLGLVHEERERRDAVPE